MARQISTVLSINGWKNLLTIARAAGYEGNSIVLEATVLNLNATVAYLHITSNGATNPDTASDGLPIGTDTTAPLAYYTLPKGSDIAGVWINTSGAQNIHYSIIGA